MVVSANGKITKFNSTKLNKHDHWGISSLNYIICTEWKKQIHEVIDQNLLILQQF